MMEIKNLISLFGEEYKNKKVVSFFSNILNIIDDIEIHNNEENAYVDSETMGFDITFKDESAYYNKGYIGETGNYYLVAYHFYSEGSDDYREYKNELINGIKVTNSRKEIREKMGVLPQIHKNTGADIWNEYNGYKIHVTYKEDETPFMITISLSELEKNKRIKKTIKTKTITLKQLSTLIPWAGLKTIEDYNKKLIQLCKEKKEYEEYLYLFENLEKSSNDINLKNIILPNNLVYEILDALGMVIFYTKNSNTLSSLTYEDEDDTIVHQEKWSKTIRDKGWKKILQNNNDDEVVVLKASDALITYGYEIIEKVYERTRVRL